MKLWCTFSLFYRRWIKTRFWISMSEIIEANFYFLFFERIVWKFFFCRRRILIACRIHCFIVIPTSFRLYSYTFVAIQNFLRISKPALMLKYLNYHMLLQAKTHIKFLCICMHAKFNAIKNAKNIMWMLHHEVLLLRNNSKCKYQNFNTKFATHC